MPTWLFSRMALSSPTVHPDASFRSGIPELPGNCRKSIRPVSTHFRGQQVQDRVCCSVSVVDPLTCRPLGWAVGTNHLLITTNLPGAAAVAISAHTLAGFKGWISRSPSTAFPENDGGGHSSCRSAADLGTMVLRPCACRETYMIYLHISYTTYNTNAPE